MKLNRIKITRSTKSKERERKGVGGRARTVISLYIYIIHVFAFARHVSVLEPLARVKLLTAKRQVQVIDTFSCRL